MVNQIRTGHQINSKEIFSMKSILCFCQLAGIQKMKTITLGQLLNEKQIVEVTRILNSSADSIERVRRLKDYFGTFRDDLEKKGVLPEYLAWAVEYAKMSGGLSDDFIVPHPVGKE